MEEIYRSSDGTTQYLYRAVVEDDDIQLAQQSAAPPTQVEGPVRQGGRRKSPLWSYFEPLGTGKKKDDVKCKACQIVLNCAQPGDDLLPHLLACSEVDASVRNHAKRIFSETKTKKRQREREYCTPGHCLCTCSSGPTVSAVGDDSTNRNPYPVIDAEEFYALVARVFYTCLMAFSIVERPAFVQLFEAIRPDLKLPTRHQLGGSLLDNHYEKTKTTVSKRIAKQGYLSFTTDAWSDQNNSSIVNFVLVSPGMKSVLWSSVATGAYAHDAPYMERLLRAEIATVQRQVVVAGLVNDNAANMAAASRRLTSSLPIFGAGCSAHVTNLLLQDIGKHVQLFSDVKSSALEIVRFVRFHHGMLATFNELRAELRRIMKRRRALVFPVATRWYSNIACFKSVLSSKDVLETLFRGENYEDLRKRYQTTPASREKLEQVQAIVRDRESVFWPALKKAVHLMEPIVAMLRKLEADSCPTSHVYARFRGLLYNEEFADERPKEFLTDASPRYETAQELCKWQALAPTDTDEAKILKLIWKRWKFVRCDVFCIAYLLDPQSNLNHFMEDDMEDAIEQACVFAEKAKLLEQHNLSKAQFKARLDKFVLARKAWPQTKRDRHEDPRTWWLLYGDKHAFLKELALTVFSVPTSSAASERAWSVYNLIHTKTRNRLGTKKVEMLAFIYVNDGELDEEEVDLCLDDFPDCEAVEFLS